MPQINTPSIEDTGRFYTNYTGSINETNQTFTFLDTQNGMTFRNKGKSPVILTVDGETHRIPPQATIEVDDNSFISFDARTQTGTQEFEITAFREKSNVSGLSGLQSQVSNLSSQLAQRATEIEKFGATGDGATDDTQAFKDAMTTTNDGTKIILKGKYLVKDPLSLIGAGSVKKNITISGEGKFATVKIKPNITGETVNGNLSGLTYSVRNYYEEFAVSSLGWKVQLHQIATGKLFDYIAVPDKTQIPSSIAGGVFIRGKTSRVEYEVASVDTNDPDGVGTARIYLFEGVNNEKKTNTLNKDGSNVLTEDIQTIIDVGYNRRYILDFGTTAVPSAFAANRKITQVSGKTARIHNVTTFVDKNSVAHNIVVVDSFSEWQNIPHYTAKPKPLNDNENVEIKTYTVTSASFGSLNKCENIILENIIFDGANYEVGLKNENGNSWNALYTYASKNVIIRNCTFKNSIMAGIQVGYAGNANSADRDFPENIIIENCYFENNGRGDIEIISAKKVSITDCYGDGKIDIEPNTNEMMEHLSVSGCSFKTFDCYSPSYRSASTKINVVNSVFDNVISQMAGTFNMANCIMRVLSSFAGTSSTLTNCRVNRFGTPIGSCAISFNNCEIYDLPRTNSGSEATNPGTANYMKFIASVIDLSLVSDMTNNSFGLILISSELISKTRLVSITRASCRMSIFRNSEINNITFVNGNSVDGYKIQGGKFLVKDTAVLTKVMTGTYTAIEVQSCYIQASIDLSGGSTAKFYDCVLDGVTKPILSAYAGLEANGIKSSLSKGIDWAWVRSCTSPALLKFNNVSISNTIPSNLGIGNGFQTPSINNVADGCTALYMNDLTKHAAILYNNGGSLVLKYVNYA